MHAADGNVKMQTVRLGHGRPRHGDQHARLHVLDQRHSLVHSVAPTFHGPALLSTVSALLQVGKLPEVVDGVEVTNLDKPGTNAFHDLTASLETASPVSLPLEQVARVKRVGSKLKDTTKLSGRGRRPEGELLHEINLLGVDELVKLSVVLGELGVVANGMARLVVSLILLILPNVNCEKPLATDTLYSSNPAY